MRHRTLAGTSRLLLGGLLALAAIGLTSGPAAGATGATGTAAPVEIARVTNNGVTVSFLTVGTAGHPEIALAAQGSLRGAVSPVPALLAQRLTSQEMYLTLAGPGAVAPAALAAAQPAEAAELGRAATVHLGQLPAPVITSSLTSCQSHVYGDISDFAGVGLWSKKSGVTYPSGSQTLYHGGISTYETRNFVGFGACNESSSLLTVDYAYNQRFNSLGWQQSSSFPAGAGGWYAWYYKWLKTVNGVPHGASYRIHGASSGAFDLVTGEWFTI
jgi:hypothetical protein